ncbi:uncharacterized protein Dwil_GK13152 [Drosophila willistoni]|uniref:DUF4776 domain-containing protein n=1 Tax=Drosophila willistoni TaxID=7260 RepID=B4NGS1_DROWI|nr:uncharacterized protein LOC6650143 [Drosophila willistoni]EDW84418.1 uncharacterized protein Dwil_GK13152 [Drosophila willistoni]
MASEMQTYKFDVVIPKTNLPPPKEEDTSSEYVFSVRIFKDFVDLPFDRMWAEDFADAPLGQILSTPCELIGSLTSKGVCVTLRNKQGLLGSGTTALTPLVLRQLTDPTFEVIQTIDMDIVHHGKNVDTIQMKLKFSAEHPDVDPENNCPYDVCRTVDKSLHPKDVVFTLGRSCKCPTTSCITDQRLMSGINAPFKCVHSPNTPQGWSCCLTGGEAPPPPPPEQDKRSERNMLKELLEDLDLDRIRVPTPPPTHAAGKKWRKKSKKRTASSSEDGSDESFNLSGGYVNVDEDERRKALGSYPIETPKLTQASHQAPTLCILCKSDVSWLPKLSACPYCGYRNYNAESEEELYDENATAKQILDVHMREDRCRSDSEEEDDSCTEDNDANNTDPKNCGCITGIPCTRCRIRKLCESIFKEKDVNINKPTPAEQNEPQKETNELEKKESTVSQRRSHLIKIFTEMRNVYDTNKKKTSQGDLLDEQMRQELMAHCGKSVKLSRARQRSLNKALKEIDRAYPSPRKPKKARGKSKWRSPSKKYAFWNSKKSDHGSRIGHNTCISDGSYTGYRKIPCHMGWMWTKSSMSRFKKWKPGAICKPIRGLMSYFLKDFPVDTICLSRYHCRSKKTRKESDASEEENLEQHPTLHISKKNGEYIITLRPLKDPKALAVCANPYADMKPVVFRITKDPKAVKMRELKTGLQDHGFPLCTCQNPIVSCHCRSHVDKERLVYAFETLCERLGLPNTSDSFIYSNDDDEDDDDADSEQEYEFGVTPPAGLVKPERLHHPDHTNAETQYMEDDWAMPSMFPHPPNPYVQYGACVVGERRGPFDWIYGKGKVHSTPPKPAQRNKPKKADKSKKRLQGGYVSEQRLKGGYVSKQVAEAFVRKQSVERIPTTSLYTKRKWHKSSSPEATSITDISAYSHLRH